MVKIKGCPVAGTESDGGGRTEGDGGGRRSSSRALTAVGATCEYGCG